MRYEPNEPYDQWIERARLYELEIAKKRISKGHDPAVVLEDLGKRMMEKMLHPLIKSLVPPLPSKEEIADSRKRYEEYMIKIGPKADHVLDEKLDQPK